MSSAGLTYTLQSTDLTDVGTYTAEYTVTLLSYPLVAPAKIVLTLIVG